VYNNAFEPRAEVTNGTLPGAASTKAGLVGCRAQQATKIRESKSLGEAAWMDALHKGSTAAASAAGAREVRLSGDSDAST